MGATNVLVAPFAAVVAVAGVVLLGWARFGRVRPWAERWAMKYLAHVDSSLVPEADLAFRRRARTYGWALSLTGTGALVVAVVEPDAAVAALWAAIAVSPPAAIAAESMLAVRKTGPTGSRVARPRAVGVGDYVPTALRWLTWFSAATAGAASLVLAVAIVARPGATRFTEVAATAGALVICAVVVVATDWAARRLVANPAVAHDEAHLYWQDALRAAGLVYAYERAPIWVAIVLTSGAQLGSVSETDLPLTALDLPFTAAGFVLLVASVVIDLRTPGSTMYFRSRLWPTLGPGQVLRPGDVSPSANRWAAA